MPQSIYDNGGMIGATLDFASTDRYVVGTTSGRLTPVYVGGVVAAGPGSAGPGTVSLTSLTGGIGTAPIQGDVVVIAYSIGSTANENVSVSINQGTITEIVDIYGDDTVDSNLGVYYSVMGATPATAITAGTTNSTANAGAIAVHVWRNIDTTTPIDTTTITASGGNSALANPPAITTVTQNAVVLAIGASGNDNQTNAFTQGGDLSNFISTGGADTESATVGMGSIATTTPATINPNPFGIISTTAYSWAAATVALRPRIGDVPVYGNFKNSGIWSLSGLLNSIDIPVQITSLSDNFETDTGWTAVGSGFTMATSSNVAYSGSFSLYRSAGTGNNGEYKLFNLRLTRGWKMSAWVYSAANGRSSPDEIFAVLNSSGNGYAVSQNENTLSIDRRLNYVSSSQLSTVSNTRTNLVWYRIELISNLDNTFTASRYDANNNLIATTTSAVDTSYTSFDRIAILGGNPFYVDELQVSAFSNSSLSTVQIIDANGVAAGSTSVTVPAHAAGDMLVVVIGNQTTTPPALLSGYTNITSQGITGGGLSRSFRLQYIIDNTNTISSISFPSGYASVFVIRGGLSIRQSNIRSTPASSTVLPIPVLSGADTNGRNLILAGSYLGTFTNPQTFSGFTAIQNEGTYIANNSLATTPDNAAFILTAAGVPLTWIVEVQ